MRDFAARRWAGPDGARLHVLIRAGISPQVRALARAYGQVLLSWSHLVRIVPLDYLHVTVAWLPAPVTAQISPERRSALVTTLTAKLSAVPTFTVVCGPAVVTSHGVRLEVTLDNGLARLDTHTREALRCVFGTDAIAEPATHNPHIALAYGTRDAPNDALAADLLTAPAYRARHRPVRAALDVAEVIVADVDTFALDPWRWRTTQLIRLLHDYPTL